jgi:branched-chain amino acid transport system substrate-binding protein
MADGDTRVALLVGCCHYDPESYQPLPAPARDVDALEHVLADQEIGDFTVRPLRDRPSGEVSEQIEELFVTERKPDDLLLLYFSCHGDLDANGQLYFIAANTKKNRLNSTGISARWVKEQMDRSRSQRIVLLLDCCYSGAFESSLTRGDTDINEILEQQLGGHGHVVITASRKFERAHDSVFTDAVVRGLQTGAADLDGDGQVSVCELYQYVHDQVSKNNPKQTPTLSVDGMRGQLILAKNPESPSPLPVALQEALRSELVWERSWVVGSLRRLLAGDHPGGQKRAARQALIGLRDNDANRRVRKAAIEALGGASDPPWSRRLVGIGSAALATALLTWIIFGPLDILKNNNAAPGDKPQPCLMSTRSADGVLSLGTLLPRTGKFVYSGPAQEAAVHLAVKDINDAGGVPGIVVKLDAANQRDEGNPAAATASQSTDALLTSGVDAIIGPATSAVAGKVIDKVTCAGVIMFAPANTAPEFTTYPDHGLYFRTAPLSTLEGSVLGKLVVADGNSTAVVMSRDDLFGNSLRHATEQRIQESGGRVLDSFHYDPSALDYKKEIQRVKAKDPDAIVLIGFTESAQILVNMIEEGIGPRSKRVYLSGANMTNTLASQVSPQDPSVLAGLRGTPLDVGGEEFVRRLREISPGLRDLTYAPQAYDAVVITALAAAIAGTDQPAAIAKEINGVTRDGERCTSFVACMTLVKDRKNIDYDGPSGRLEFSDPGEPSVGAYVISEIQADGTVKAIRSETVSGK